MSVLDDTFTFFATPPKGGYVWEMDATLTGTKQVSDLPGFVATAGGAQNVTYDSGAHPQLCHLPQRSASMRRFNSNLSLGESPRRYRLSL